MLVFTNLTQDTEGTGALLLQTLPGALAVYHQHPPLQPAPRSFGSSPKHGPALALLNHHYQPLCCCNHETVILHFVFHHVNALNNGGTLLRAVPILSALDISKQGLLKADLQTQTLAGSPLLQAPGMNSSSHLLT